MKASGMLLADSSRYALIHLCPQCRCNNAMELTLREAILLVKFVNASLLKRVTASPLLISKTLDSSRSTCVLVIQKLSRGHMLAGDSEGAKTLKTLMRISLCARLFMSAIKQSWLVKAKLAAIQNLYCSSGALLGSSPVVR